MKQYTLRMCIIAAGAATAAAGCGASPSSNAGSNPGPTTATTQPAGTTLSGPDACALLTTDQVASATNHDVQSHAARTPLLGASECVWDVVSHGPSQNEVDKPQVTVTVYLSKFVTPATTFENLSLSGTPVSGIGDRAASVNAEGEGIKLVVLKNVTVLVIFTNISRTVGQDSPVNEALGRVAVQNL